MGGVNLNNQQDLKELMYGTDEYGKKLAKECAESVLSDREEQNSQKCMASSRSFYGGNHTPNVVYSEWPGASNYVDGNDNQEVPQDDCSIVQQQIISDWSSKNADSSNFNSEECDSDDSPFLEVLEESSSLVEQKLPLTEDEKKIINKSLEEIEEVTKKNDQEYKKSLLDPNINWTKSALERIREITDKYLRKGIRLNSCCSGCDKTVTNLIFEKIIGVLESTTNTTSGSEALGFGPMDYHEDEATKDENISVIHDIVKDLLLKGGKVKRHLFYYDRISHATTAFINYSSGESFDQYLSDKYKEIKSRLKGVVYESVVNKSNKIQEDELEVEMDNGHFYIKYMQDSIVEPARITNSQEMKKSGLKVCVLQIGESTIKFESKEGKRNYADLTDKSDIVLTFYTSLGELEVRLYPDKQNKDLIRVEVTNQDLLERLRDCKEEVGKNCLFGGYQLSKP